MPRSGSGVQASGGVQISIYDINGVLIRTLLPRTADGAKGAIGPRTILWEGNDLYGRDVASGTYIIRVKSGEHVFTKRAALLR